MTIPIVRADPRTDEELLNASRTDAQAFAAFYDRYFAVVLGFFRNRVRGGDVAFDLTAETFAAVLVSLDRFRPEAGLARSWLFGIARNKLNEALRAGEVEDRARRELMMQPVTLDEEDLRVIDSATSSPVLELLEDLPVAQKEAITARHLDDREYAEIAREIKCSESVVRKRVSRGLARLRSKPGEVEG
jgi:RNA polymerase sigma-70 factor (ECF subfamily)